jgi:hypothetical protein
VDRFGLVESISVNSAPASITGRKFELGMRNVITGPNASGKSILTRLIASVAYPDHVANISRYRDVDFDVRWFDPGVHDVATSGRSGNVTHVLDGEPVPYVARPYKAILLEGTHNVHLGSLISLAQYFDLSASAMRATLSALPESAEFVKEVRVTKTRVEWIVDVGGRTVTYCGGYELSGSMEATLVMELAAIHARHHARVEPTFLLF